MLGSNSERRAALDELVDITVEGIVDDVASLMKFLRERQYGDAALFAYGLSENLAVISAGLAAEALVRKIEDRVDNPE